MHEHAPEAVGGRVAETEQVDVLRRPDRLAEPHQEQRSALEDEPVGELRGGQAVQQAFASETRKRQLMLDAEFSAPFDEPA